MYKVAQTKRVPSVATKHPNFGFRFIPFFLSISLSRFDKGNNDLPSLSLKGTSTEFLDQSAANLLIASLSSCVTSYNAENAAAGPAGTAPCHTEQNTQRGVFRRLP